MKSLCRLALLLVIYGSGSAQFVYRRPIVINVGDDWQAASDAGTVGQPYLVKTGTHRLQSVTPKAGQSFNGESGAIMSGARLLTSPTGSNPWAYTGQTQAGDQAGTCRATEPECQHPEDVFFDSVLLHHVSTLGEVTTGTWFFNYATDTVYIGDNPSGHTVEISVTPAAFVSEGSVVLGVSISNLTIEKYASVGNKGTISAPNGQSWNITKNVLRLNHAVGIVVGSRSNVRRNYGHHNGQAAIGGYNATGLLYEDNELSFNGGLFDPFWGAAGLKVAFLDRTVIRRNYAHDNRGGGLWCDVDCANVLFEDNTAEDNDQFGIFYEISFAGTIRRNYVRRNGFDAGDGPAQAGIYIAASADVEAYDNTVEDNSWGIFALQEDRGSSPAYSVKWAIQNLSVHDNSVRMSNVGYIGLGQTEGDNSYFTSKNNHFEGNTYLLQGSTSYFGWDGLTGASFPTWQGYGNDSPAGSATTF